MKARSKRLISSIIALTMCLSCLQPAALYASEQNFTEAEVILEESPEAFDSEYDAYEEAPKVQENDTTDISILDETTDEPESADIVPESGAEPGVTDTKPEGNEEYVGTTAVVQASKSSEDPPYVGGATTKTSGPANPRTAKTYILDLNEKDYPIGKGRYFDYLQSVGILYPGDKLVIIPETDPIPGEDGYHGVPGRVLKENGKWVDLKTGDQIGPLLISDAKLMGIAVPKYYVREITVVDEPVLMNYSGSGNSYSSSYAVNYEYEAGVHGSSYYGASSLVWVSMPNYHPVEYTYINNTPYDSYSGIKGEEFDQSTAMTFGGANPTVIYAEDLSTSYNPIDGYETVGPEFTIYHPQIKGYKFDSVYAVKETTADKNFEPTWVSTSEDGTSSQWRFYFHGSYDYNWSFDCQKHGDEQDPIKIKVTYYEAKTATLNPNGGLVDAKQEAVYPFKYRTSRGTSWYSESFDLADHTPVRDGYVFTGWYADSNCTELISAADSKYMQAEFRNYLEDNNICQKNIADENCAENVEIYAGWGKASATDIKAATIGNLSAKTYTGNPQTQSPTVTLDGKTLTYGTDYVTSYKSNTDAGTAYIYITGKGNYRGVASATFKINPKQLTPIITLDQTEFVYDGTYHRPGYTITIKEGTQLTESEDYTVSVYSQRDAGRSSATVRLRGNYTGTATAEYYVRPKAVDSFDATLSVTSFTYDGNAKQPKPNTITIDGETARYTITYKNNINVGTAEATITLTGNFTGSKTLTFTIVKATQKWDVTLDLTNYDLTYNYYTPICPPVIVSANGTNVTEANYTLTYSNNRNAGKAAVEVLGTNEYAGWYGSTEFTINKAETNLRFSYSSVSKKTTDASFRNTLYGNYDGTITYTSSNTNVAAVNSSNGMVTLAGPGTTTITATVTEGQNYKAGSASYTITAEGPVITTTPTPTPTAAPTPTPKPSSASSGFSDVQDPKHAYYKAIYWAANEGITKGYPDGTFGINRNCTRGEMMMFLWRYAGNPKPKTVSKSPFKDVPKTHAYYKAILWGSQKGITKGYSDGTFGINKNVTRGACMMFLWRLKKQPTPKAVSTSPFKDVPKTHAYYKAILWGSQKKVTTGYTSGAKKGTFGIDENCTRGAIVTFLYRARSL